jgi:hypothetical protein
MYRIFKKTHDLAARATEARPRRPRRQHLGLEALEGRQLLSLGNEFRVNFNTPFAQFSSDSASSANGMSVAVWVTQAGGTNNDIHAQVFSPQGLRLGGEIFVETSAAAQQQPKVAMDAQGNFVVVYQELNNGQNDIIARRVTVNPNNTGQHQVGPRIQVEPNSLSQSDPDVAMDAAGDFVVSFTEESIFHDGTTHIFADTYNSSGQQLNGFAVSADFSTVDTHSTVAMSPDGSRFDVAYSTSPTGHINLARLSTTGVGAVLSNGPIKFLNQFPIFGGDPSIAMDNAGNAVVAWDARTTGGTGDPPPTTVNAIRVSSSGSFSDDILTNVFGALRPSVALSPTGGSFVVASEINLGRTVPSSVDVTEFNGSNTKVLDTVLAAPHGNFVPAVSVAGNGNYLLTYNAFVSGFEEDIHGRFGHLPGAPAAQNLALTSPIKPGHSATLSGQLVDGDGDTNLTLTVDWGDGSQPEQSQPGLDPFAVKHKYRHAGTYTVHATWTDSTGLSNSQDLTIVVTRHRVKSGSQAARRHRA